MVQPVAQVGAVAAKAAAARALPLPLPGKRRRKGAEGKGTEGRGGEEEELEGDEWIRMMNGGRVRSSLSVRMYVLVVIGRMYLPWDWLHEEKRRLNVVHGRDPPLGEITNLGRRQACDMADKVMLGT